MKRIITVCIAALLSFVTLHAAPAYPRPIKVTQPDGTVLTIRTYGDEYLHWTTCGDYLVSLGTDGYYHYSSFSSDGSSLPTGSRVYTTTSGDGSGVLPPASAVEKARQMRTNSVSSQSSGSESSSISMGEKHFLVLLIEFADTKFTIQNPTSAFSELLNSRNYTYNEGTGSVWQYYNDNSHNRFSPIYDVYGPITVSGKSETYAHDDVQAVIEACKYADEVLGVDFTRYCYVDPTLVDNIFYYFAGHNQAEGGGSSTIWPHSVTYSSPFLTLDGVGIYRYACSSEYRGSQGNEMAGIGTFTHEFGHTLGLPDLYDTDYGTNGSGKGLGVMSLMASGNYNNNGRTPPYLTYEERHILGWDNGIELLKEGENFLNPVSANKSYYSPTSNDGEYFVYESRPCKGWDTYTGAAGMAIYHVDRSGNIMPNGLTAKEMWEKTNMINAYSVHQCMDLIESAYPENQVRYSDQLVFPGHDNVTSYTSGTYPGAYAWSGYPTGYNLTDIAFNQDGTTSLTMTKEYSLYGIVRNKKGQAVSGADISVTFNPKENVSANHIQRLENNLQFLNFAPAQSGTEYGIKTDENGKFSIPIYEEGTCLVKVNKDGYLNYQTSCTISSTTTLEITMVTPQDESSIHFQKYIEVSTVAMGGGEGVDMYGGFKYTSEELTDYVGADITSISFQTFNPVGASADKLGVRVYFDNELQCDCETDVKYYGTMCTVDIGDSKVKIPEGKSVLFAYYIINPSYACSCHMADWENPVENGNWQSRDGVNWFNTNGDFIISASITLGDKVLDLAGINYIFRQASYKAGDTFELKLVESSVNPPSSFSWSVNGVSKRSGEKVTLYTGTTVVKAILTFPSGRKETKEIKLMVK